jgi:hypothetical protein
MVFALLRFTNALMLIMFSWCPLTNYYCCTLTMLCLLHVRLLSNWVCTAFLWSHTSHWASENESVFGQRDEFVFLTTWVHNMIEMIATSVRPYPHQWKGWQLMTYACECPDSESYLTVHLNLISFTVNIPFSKSSNLLAFM